MISCIILTLLFNLVNSMEQMPNSPLNPLEESMYEKFVSKNPGVTKEDFKELRGLALNKGGGVKKFFALNGVVMEESPAPEELHEMKDIHDAA